MFQKDSNPNSLAYAAYGKGKGKDMRKVQCFSCREYGHIAADCEKRTCNYCKKQGHFIKECPTLSQNRPVTMPALTPEMIQELEQYFPTCWRSGSSVGEDTREGA